MPGADNRKTSPLCDHQFSGAPTTPRAQLLARINQAGAAHGLAWVALLGADRALAHSGVPRARAAGWLLVALGLGICAAAGVVAVYVMASK